MDAKFPFTMKGKHFVLNTELNWVEGAGWKFEKSNLGRLFYTSRIPVGADDRALERNFQVLRKNMSSHLQIVILEPEKIYWLSAAGFKVFAWDYYQTLGELQKRRSDLFILPNSYKEEETHFNLLNETLTELIGAEFWQNHTHTIFSGELVWSGWFDLYTLMRLLLSNPANAGYFTLDSYGIWQYCLNHLGKDKRLKSLNKSVFTPDLTLIDTSDEMAGGARKIKISKNDTVKSLHVLYQAFMLFDLGQEGYVVADNGSYLARFLLVKNRKQAKVVCGSYDKQKQLFQSSCLKERVLFYPHQKLGEKTEVEVMLTTLAEIVSGPVLNSSVNINDTLCELEREEEKYLDMPQGSELAVVEGQIVVKGHTLGVVKNGGKSNLITAKYAGKVSLRLLDKGILVIKTDKKNTTLPALFPGKILSVDKENKIKILTKGFTVGLRQQSLHEFNGILTENTLEGTLSGINPLLPVVVYLRDPDKPAINDFLLKLGVVAGVIVRNESCMNEQLLEMLNKQSIPLVYLEADSDNSSPVIEKLLHYNLGKFVCVKGNEILIPETNLTGIETVIGNEHVSGTPVKGSGVMFLNYQSSCLYGKIEKSLTDGSNNYLINAPDGIFESRAENLILLS